MCQVIFVTFCYNSSYSLNVQIDVSGCDGSYPSFTNGKGANSSAQPKRRARNFWNTSHLEGFLLEKVDHDFNEPFKKQL